MKKIPNNEEKYFVQTSKYLVHVRCMKCNEYMNQVEREEEEYNWIYYQCPKCKDIISLEQSEVIGNTLHNIKTWKKI